MARSAIAADRMLSNGEGDSAFLEDKLATCRFYLEQLVPTVFGLESSVTAGSGVLYEVDLTVA